MSDDNALWSEAVYGAVSRQPMVKLSFGSETALIPTDNARQVGLDIILTAMAAEADAFLVEFLQEKLSADPEIVVAILGDFREWRLKKGLTDDKPE